MGVHGAGVDVGQSSGLRIHHEGTIGVVFGALWLLRGVDRILDVPLVPGLRGHVRARRDVGGGGRRWRHFERLKAELGSHFVLRCREVCYLVEDPALPVVELGQGLRGCIPDGRRELNGLVDRRMHRGGKHGRGRGRNGDGQVVVARRGGAGRRGVFRDGRSTGVVEVIVLMLSHLLRLL